MRLFVSPTNVDSRINATGDDYDKKEVVDLKGYWYYNFESFSR